MLSFVYSGFISLVVTCSTISSVAITTDKQALSYLSNYGYMEAVQNDTGSSQQTANYKDQIRRFQAKYGLNITEELDKKTKQLMSKPRCSLPDEISTNTTRQKRFILHGSKWNKTNLSFNIKSYPSSSLHRSDVDSIIERALKVWSDVSPLTFEKKTDGADINIHFVLGVHGDAFDFDGPLGNFGHGFFPASGGAVHLDDAEDWSTTAFGINLFSTAVHEFGHSLGLQHSDIKDSIMAPFYQGDQPELHLYQDDIDAITALYGNPLTGPVNLPPVYKTYTNSGEMAGQNPQTATFNPTIATTHIQLPNSASYSQTNVASSNNATYGSAAPHSPSSTPSMLPSAVLHQLYPSNSNPNPLVSKQDPKSKNRAASEVSGKGAFMPPQNRLYASGSIPYPAPKMNTPRQRLYPSNRNNVQKFPKSSLNSSNNSPQHNNPASSDPKIPKQNHRLYPSDRIPVPQTPKISSGASNPNPQHLLYPGNNIPRSKFPKVKNPQPPHPLFSSNTGPLVPKKTPIAGNPNRLYPFNNIPRHSISPPKNSTSDHPLYPSNSLPRPNYPKPQTNAENANQNHRLYPSGRHSNSDPPIQAPNTQSLSRPKSEQSSEEPRLQNSNSDFSKSFISSSPNICTDPKIDAITTTKDGSSYAFKGEHYYKLTATGYDVSSPRMIRADWGIFGFIDAALTTDDGYTYLFQGTRCWKFVNRQLLKGYPKIIPWEFPGIPSGFQSSFQWGGDGIIYFVKGNRVWRYLGIWVDYGYPTLPGQIDAAFRWTNGRTYLFSGKQYYRLNDRDFKVDVGYPRDIASWWFGCTATSGQRLIRNKPILMRSPLETSGQLNVHESNNDTANFMIHGNLSALQALYNGGRSGIDGIVMRIACTSLLMTTIFF